MANLQRSLSNLNATGPHRNTHEHKGSLLKWLGFYPCLSIVTRRCDVCPHPLVIGMTDINLQPSELCSLILSCNSISPSSIFGSHIFFLS